MKIKNKNIIIILFIYLIIFIIFSIYNYNFLINIINPLFWIFILIYFYFYKINHYLILPQNKRYLLICIIIVIISFIFNYYLGIYLGYLKNPLNYNLNNILKNILIIITPLISIELTRSITINNNLKNKFILTILTIIFILLEINYHYLINIFSYKEELFKYIVSNIIPLIASNILFNYLVTKDKYISLLLTTLNKLIILLLPISPNLNWFLNDSLNLIKIIIIYILFKYIFTQDQKNLKNTSKNYFTILSYALTLIFATFIVCFMLGLFKYESIAILSNSMSPTFQRGDIIIYEKLPKNKLKQIPKDTIIVYKKNNIIIAHRIYKVMNNTYITKGDNNNIYDNYEIKIDDIKGIYKFHFKYLGYPSIWLYEYFNSKK